MVFSCWGHCMAMWSLHVLWWRSSSSYLGCYSTLIDRTYNVKLVTGYCAILVPSCLAICAFARYCVGLFCVCVRSTHGPQIGVPAKKILKLLQVPSAQICVAGQLAGGCLSVWPEVQYLLLNFQVVIIGHYECFFQSALRASICWFERVHTSLHRETVLTIHRETHSTPSHRFCTQP